MIRGEVIDSNGELIGYMPEGWPGYEEEEFVIPKRKKIKKIRIAS
mgnify:CR=1 FL=1